MRLVIKFSVLFLCLVCLTMSFRATGELMGHNLEQPSYIVETEEDFIENHIICQKEEKLQQLLERYEKFYRFNGSVLVSYKGRVICEKSLGYEDLKKKDEPLSLKTPFQLASVSKQFTAVAALMLHEQGKLNIDEEVKTYIPQWPYPGMTVRHLLNHTSGLPNYMWLVEHKWKSDHAPYNHEVVSLLIDQNAALNFVPGKYHSYSNTGYVVLAYLIERVSGKFFADFLHENIFEPLQMNSSFAYSQTINRKNQDKIIGYNSGRRGYRMIPETIHDGCNGDKGIYSTVEDLYRWDQALYSGNLLSRQLMEEAFSMSELKSKKKIPYGFGFRIREDEDRKVVYHHGLWNGFRTSFIRFMDNSSSIIVLNNTNSDAKHILVKDIEEILFSEEEIPSDELAMVSGETEASN